MIIKDFAGTKRVYSENAEFLGEITTDPEDGSFKFWPNGLTISFSSAELVEIVRILNRMNVPWDTK